MNTLVLKLSFRKPLGMSLELWFGPVTGSSERETELDALNKEMPDWKEWEQLSRRDWQLRLLNKVTPDWRDWEKLSREIGSWDCWTNRHQTGETERCSPEEIGSWDCWAILHSLKDLVSPSRSSYPYKCAKLPIAYTSPDLCKHEVNWVGKLSLVIIDSLYQ